MHGILKIHTSNEGRQGFQEPLVMGHLSLTLLSILSIVLVPKIGVRLPVLMNVNLCRGSNLILFQAHSLDTK